MSTISSTNYYSIVDIVDIVVYNVYKKSDFVDDFVDGENPCSIRLFGHLSTKSTKIPNIPYELGGTGGKIPPTLPVCTCLYTRVRGFVDRPFFGGVKMRKNEGRRCSSAAMKLGRFWEVRNRFREEVRDHFRKRFWGIGETGEERVPCKKVNADARNRLAGAGVGAGAGAGIGGAAGA